MPAQLYRSPFLERMRRKEGLPPSVPVNDGVRLGTTRERVYELSLAVALVVVIVSFRFFPFQVTEKKVIVAARENVTVEDVAQTRQENRPPPPPRPPIPIEAPAAEALEDVDITSSELNVAADVPPPPPPADDNVDEDNYFVVVEDLPQLIGGYEGLMRRIVYPQVALRAGIQGKVQLLAYVNERGGVDRVDVVQGLSGGLTEAAIDAVKQSSFIPGKQRGRPVKVKVALVVRFAITGSS